MLGQVFYNPSDQGYESQVKERVERWRQAQQKALEDLQREAEEK
jgi:uncharacterized protein YbjQ (UPF0145 family)